MSKSQTDTKEYAIYFKALSNPNRLAIFKQLASCCTPGTSCSIEDAGRCVGDIGESLEVAASTLSHHLKELHSAGLIEMQRKGKQVMCKVDPDVLVRLQQFFTDISKT